MATFVSDVFYRRIVKPVQCAIMQGITPRKLAISFAVGLCGGIFPIPGVTMVITVCLSYLVGANVAVSSVVNLVSTPLLFLFMPLFIQLGSDLLGIRLTPISFKALLDEIQSDFVKSSRVHGVRLLYGILGWLVASPLVVAVGFLVMRPITTYLLRRNSENTTDERKSIKKTKRRSDSGDIEIGSNLNHIRTNKINLSSGLDRPKQTQSKVC